MSMSAPWLILKAGVELFRSGEIWHDLYVSGVEFVWGFALSVVIGIPFRIATGWYKKLAYIFDPFINALNGASYHLVRNRDLSKIGIIFIGAVFPLIINARDGVKTTPVTLIDAAKSFGASRWRIFTSVVLPSSVPFILTGLRLAVGRALVGVFVGELYAATAGIGYDYSRRRDISDE